MLIILTVAATIPALAGTPSAMQQGSIAYRSVSMQKDSVGRARFTNVDEMARRVDSLQFIVVYNGELLRQDLSSKVIWIYVMLGVMIVASMMMYGALNQAQRQRKDLEERIFRTVAASVSELETKIKQIQSSLDTTAPKRPAAPVKKKKASRA
jgi:hypothetical protein